MVAYSLSWLPRNGNQNTTHKSDDLTEFMSKINDVEELSEAPFYKNL